MSKRFQTWVETWVEDNVRPGNPDLESYEAQAKRLAEKMLADAAGAGFSHAEIEEDRKRVTRLVQAAVSDGTEFDIDAYRLKSALAMENEDGD